MSEKQEVKNQEQENQTAPEGEVLENNKQAEESAEPQAGEENPGELEIIKQELGELKDQNLRLYAEFENFRKRTARERAELYGTANRELMEALLPVLDDFKRALKAQEDSASEGIQLIYSKLENTLKNKGLKPMEDSTGKEFDVDSMEAITRIPAPEEKLKGKVIDEVERGYMLGNKILRYAKVVVGE